MTVRIASLLPAATEIVVALGLADHLVAVTFECAADVRAWCPVVVDTAIPAGLDPAEIDSWVRERAARDLPLRRCTPTPSRRHPAASPRFTPG